MKIVDTGVLESSFMDFSIPSEFARSCLYYCPQFGHFYCDEQYSISRNSLDLFLAIYVVKGSVWVETRGREYTALENQVILLDCRSPHHYYCREKTEFLWFHFAGNSSVPYGEYLYEHFGVVFEGEHLLSLQKTFQSILSEARANLMNEHVLSLRITQVLCQLTASPQRTVIANQMLSPAIDYISKHYSQEIDLKQLAALCSISIPHLIRCFKKYVNCTPHDYLLSYRLRQAKQLLTISAHSVEQIADECGFNSASHFTRAFRKSTGSTPSEFRTMQF